MRACLVILISCRIKPEELGQGMFQRKRLWGAAILLMVRVGGELAADGAALADPPSFTPLGDLPGGTSWSGTGGVSADGLIVAGSSTSNCVGNICNSEAFI